MANYNVDIAVALKGAKKLTAFKKDVRNTELQVKGLNQSLKNAAKDQKLFIKSFENLNTVLSTAKSSFNAVASGTLMQKKAARELVVAERNLNKEYQQREKLLQSIRRNQSGFAQFSRGASQVSSPTVFDTASQKSIDRNRRNQNRIAGRSSVPFGPQPFIGPLPMQGPMFGPMQGPMAGPKQMLGPGNFKGRILANLGQSKLEREIAAAGSNRGGLGGGFKEFNKNAKKIQADTKKISTIVAQNQAQGIQAFGNQQFAQPIGPVRPGPLGRLGIGTGANPKGMFANPRGKAGRISGGLSNALIGGGFPLLFGQGALGAAGGGIGGAVGGALGGPFGFGLSIAGTAIAQRIAEGQDFEKQIDKVNKSILATGSSATFTSQDIKKLGKTLGMTKQEALQAAQSFKAFDAAMRTSLLVTFGDEATFNLIKGLKTNVGLINDIQEAESIIGREKADQLLTSLRTEGSLKVQKKLQEEIIKVRENERIGNKNKVTNFDRFMGFGRTLGNKYLNFFGQGPGAGNAKVTGEDIKDIRIDKILGENLQDKTTAVTQLGVEFERAMGIKLTSNIAAVRDELEMLMDPINQLTTLAETVGSAFGESFKGLIKGSMSAQEALRNLFMRTADHFLDMAAQMIAKQIQMSILGIGFKFFGGGGAGASSVPFITDTNLSGNNSSNFLGGANPFKADGGPVKAGGSYIVGERGPEMFSPGVSGMITPNHALGGGTTVVVNVDASGSNVEGDEQQGRELGRLISVAVQSELIQQQRPGGLLA